MMNVSGLVVKSFNQQIYRKIAWPSGLRRRFKAPVTSVAGSNPTAVKFSVFRGSKLPLIINFTGHIFYVTDN